MTAQSSELQKAAPVLLDSRAEGDVGNQQQTQQPTVLTEFSTMVADTQEYLLEEANQEVRVVHTVVPAI